MEEVPDGLMAHEMIRDLRFIKLSPRERSFVVRMREEFKNRNLSLDEESRLRLIYRNHAVAIRQLKESEQNARVSLAKEARGHKHVSSMITEASTVGAQRNRADLSRLHEEIEQLEKEERDFGF